MPKPTKHPWRDLARAARRVACEESSPRTFRRRVLKLIAEIERSEVLLQQGRNRPSPSALHCPCCGAKLQPVSPQDPYWGDFCEGYRRENGTEWYLCPSKRCTYHDAPLVLFNSYHGWNHPAGDNWAIGWVK